MERTLMSHFWKGKKEDGRSNCCRLFIYVAYSMPYRCRCGKVIETQKAGSSLKEELTSFDIRKAGPKNEPKRGYAVHRITLKNY